MSRVQLAVGLIGGLVTPFLLASYFVKSPTQPETAKAATPAMPQERPDAELTSAQLTADEVLAILAQSAIDSVSWAEVGWTPDSNTEDAYRTMFGGAKFDSFADHPDQMQTVETEAGIIRSVAAGRFQFMTPTWDELYAQYEYWPTGPNGEKFIPLAQDLAFLRLFAKTGAFYHLEFGVEVVNQRITVRPEAIAKAMNAAAATWCALPSLTAAARGECNDPRQSQKGMAETIANFEAALLRNQIDYLNSTDRVDEANAIMAIEEAEARGKGATLGITGNTGRSTGPHLDIRYGRGYDPNRNRPTEEHLSRLLVDGKPLSAFPLTSEHRSRNKDRQDHDGVDYGTPVGGLITAAVPIAAVSSPVWDTKGGGWYTSVAFPDGVVLNLLHLDGTSKYFVR